MYNSINNSDEIEDNIDTYEIFFFEEYITRDTNVKLKKYLCNIAVNILCWSCLVLSHKFCY